MKSPRLLAGLLLALASTAGAQQQQSPEADTAKNSYPNTLFGTWGGPRKRLYDRGIDLDASYITEESFGLDHGISKLFYVHQIELDATLDMKKLIGLGGGTINVVMVNREGHNLSDEKIHNEFRTQELFGAGKDIRLVYLTYEQSLAGDHVDLLFGRTNIGQDFAYSKLFCNFQSNAICGRPRSLVDNGDFSNFPLSAYGGRLRVKPFGENSYVQIGAFEANPRLASPRDGFGWTTRGDTGAVLPAEAGLVIGQDKRGTQGNYKIGVIYDTSRFSDRYYDANGLPFALTGLPPRRTRGRASGYAMADQQVARFGGDPKRTLTLLTGVTLAPASTAKYDAFWYAGLLAKAPFASRPGDTFGFIAQLGHVGDALADTEAIEVTQGRNMHVEHSEIVYEVNYNLRVKAWFHVTPGLQHVVHPGADPRRPAVDVVDLKTAVTF